MLSLFASAKQESKETICNALCSQSLRHPRYIGMRRIEPHLISLVCVGNAAGARSRKQREVSLYFTDHTILLPSKY
jgi:hypothetical protein